MAVSANNGALLEFGADLHERSAAMLRDVEQLLPGLMVELDVPRRDSLAAILTGQLLQCVD